MRIDCVFKAPLAQRCAGSFGNGQQKLEGMMGAAEDRLRARVQAWGAGRAAWACAHGRQPPWVWAMPSALRSAPKSPQILDTRTSASGWCRIQNWFPRRNHVWWVGPQPGSQRPTSHLVRQSGGFVEPGPSPHPSPPGTPASLPAGLRVSGCENRGALCSSWALTWRGSSRVISGEGPGRCAGPAVETSVFCEVG